MNINTNENELLKKGVTETDGLIIIAPDIIGENIGNRLIKEHQEYLKKHDDDCNQISFDDALYYIDDNILNDIQGAILQNIDKKLEIENLYLI